MKVDAETVSAVYFVYFRYYNWPPADPAVVLLFP